MTKLQPVRGTRDIFGADASAFEHVVDTFRSVAKRFCFQPVATPIFEFTPVFARTMGDTSDALRGRLPWIVRAALALGAAALAVNAAMTFLNPAERLGIEGAMGYVVGGAMLIAACLVLSTCMGGSRMTFHWPLLLKAVSPPIKNH
ncbi:MAG: hypothetical protein AAF337_15345, partial [Pseudomonadota bacterium]